MIATPPRRILTAIASLFTIWAVPYVSAEAGPLGIFNDHADIGSPKLPGSATYNAVTQNYTISAAGFNMWAERDEFHFVWKKMKGDFVLRARVRFIGDGVDPHRKLGWMIRTSLDADSAYADAAIHGDGLTSLQYRKAKGEITEQVESTAMAPDIVQLEKKGNRYTMSVAKFGEPLLPCVLPELNLGDELYVGLYVCSHNADVVETAVFSNVRIIRPARDDFRPYRDYIGSRLEVLDVESGHRQILHSSAKPFEAPNWTPDGSALIYNGSGSGDNRGKLYRFDLATRRERMIDTGFADRNNNDHVLSFDGSMLAISHHYAENDGGSTIFTVPVTGGTPKLITPKAPSYLHGWSPDAKWLVYTGGRDNEYDIYKIRSDGDGKEIKLTDYIGLDDGPEFSPGGKFIYFNSVRSGTMQIWRMKPDGSEPEQVTHDSNNNWFPHLSPDGKWIAYIAFSEDVDPTDHPYYKHVTLRLLPTEGGTARVIAYVYGGQGTINVPSWSPDSKMLAFVSNSADTVDD